MGATCLTCDVRDADLHVDAKGLVCHMPCMCLRRRDIFEFVPLFTSTINTLITLDHYVGSTVYFYVSHHPLQQGHHWWWSCLLSS